MIRRPAFRALERGLAAGGVLLVVMWFGQLCESSVFQSSESDRLDGSHQRVHEPAGSTPQGSTLAVVASGALGRIEIPRLGIRAMCAEGTDPGVLERAVGHVSGTASPGNPGNVALAGHRDSFFNGLGEIRKDDQIRLVTPLATYTYAVEWTAIVEPERVDVLEPTASPSLTLITCFPFRWVGPAPRRFVVRAVQTNARIHGPSGPSAGVAKQVVESPAIGSDSNHGISRPDSPRLETRL